MENGNKFGPNGSFDQKFLDERANRSLFVWIFFELEFSFGKIKTFHP